MPDPANVVLLGLTASFCASLGTAVGSLGALLSVGYGRGQAIGVGTLTGLVEPLGGLVGAVAVSGAAALMPWALAFAAGAMLFIISDEIIPETHRRGNQNLATFSLLGGFVLMMLLNAVIG